MTGFLNIAAYKFATLSDLKELREELIASCKSWKLKGTILLSTEGINLFVAGGQEEIGLLLGRLRQIAGLEDLTPKISESAEQPFSRMLVRIKKEIIAFGVPEVQPGKRTSQKLPAQTLKQWLDEGRPVTLLDTRNDYEVKLGTFKNAKALGIDHFRDFPKAVAELPGTMKTQPIVMFCTGGIRCEKAGPFMEMKGFEQIFQLEGGILKYFEECGNAHYDGECFVFDQRVGVDPSLRETASAQCYVCQTPLTEEDQQDSRHVEGKSCRYCYRPPEVQMAEVLARRHASIRAITTPLPGSAPYDNYRPINISTPHDGLTLGESLGRIFPQCSAEIWQTRCAAGRLLDEERRPVSLERTVRAGERYLHLITETVEPEINPAIRILYEDEAIIVLEKPAPLPVHPGGRFNRNTLQFILDAVYAPQKPRPGHRLDAETTGIMVFSRTRRFAGILQPQFTQRQVGKVYLANVHGHPPREEFTCHARLTDEPGKFGLREIGEEEGLVAETRFKVLARLDDGTSLLEAYPVTGRTNQIRIHLQDAGFSIVGDAIYRGEEGTGRVAFTGKDASLCLHAWKLRFRHPLTGLEVEFAAERPEWAKTREQMAQIH